MSWDRTWVRNWRSNLSEPEPRGWNHNSMTATSTNTCSSWRSWSKFPKMRNKLRWEYDVLLRYTCMHFNLSSSPFITNPARINPYTLILTLAAFRLYHSSSPLRHAQWRSRSRQYKIRHDQYRPEELCGGNEGTGCLGEYRYCDNIRFWAQVGL